MRRMHVGLEGKVRVRHADVPHPMYHPCFKGLARGLWMCLYWIEMDDA
jgi:hypothetical protein